MDAIFILMLGIIALLLALIASLVISRGAMVSDFSGEWAQVKPRNLLDADE